MYLCLEEIVRKHLLMSSVLEGLRDGHMKICIYVNTGLNYAELLHAISTTHMALLISNHKVENLTV